ncbi:MAG: hypothetical protein AAF467_02000 [Actinomycetota bacterium]
MSFAEPICPDCPAPLVLTHTGTLDSWVCPTGHGLGLTLTESYEQLQEDEIRELWQLVRHPAATEANRACPMCRRAMRLVDAEYDSDEALAGEAGDGPAEGSVELDVCEPCQVLWFEQGELEAFPEDLPDPEPTGEELQALATIRETFGQSLVDAYEAREASKVSEQIYRRFLRRSRVLHSATGWMTSSR